MDNVGPVVVIHGVEGLEVFLRDGHGFKQELVPFLHLIVQNLAVSKKKVGMKNNTNKNIALGSVGGHADVNGEHLARSNKPSSRGSSVVANLVNPDLERVGNKDRSVREGKHKLGKQQALPDCFVQRLHQTPRCRASG